MLEPLPLMALLAEGTSLRQVEPGIFSVFPEDDRGNSYDGPGALSLYDQVACNRFYNRLVWGYWPSAFDRLCRDALAGATGWFLDAGCGSLAFTAKPYADCRNRSVVCLDRSLTLLRLAKKRLLRLAGRMPENVVLVHADALAMPFRSHCFPTVLAMNLLHAVPDATALIEELARLAQPDGTMILTTLVRAGRLSDRYLEMWARAGEIIPREREEVLGLLAAMGLAATARQEGNMLFLSNA